MPVAGGWWLVIFAVLHRAISCWRISCFPFYGIITSIASLVVNGIKRTGPYETLPPPPPIALKDRDPAWHPQYACSTKLAHRKVCRREAARSMRQTSG
jgi:hypothetical protein